MFITSYKNNVKTCHCSAGGVGSMCGCRDDDFVSLCLSFCFKVSSDGHQTCIFTGRSGIGLKRTFFESGDDAKVIFQFLEDGEVSFSLFCGSKRMDIGEF